MSRIHIAGVDPALRHVGIARADYDTETGEVTNVHVSLITTVKSKKQITLQELANAYEIHQALASLGMTNTWIMAEIPIGSQSANAAKALGIATGVITAIPANRLVPLTAREGKMAAVGKPTATKLEMIMWATSLYPDAGWTTRNKKGMEVFLNENEHAADAVAMIHAGINSGFKTLKTRLDQ